MNFWDHVSKGMGKIADRLDDFSQQRAAAHGEFSVLDKDYCWEDLDYCGEYTLQRHVVTEQCRIIDGFGSVKNYGTLTEMEAVMQRFSMPHSAAPVCASYGDIIGVVRNNGTYEHYGIYVSDTCVVHYATPASKPLSPATIHCTSLRYFLKDDGDYFVLDFPHPNAAPIRIGNEPAAFTANPDGTDRTNAAAHLADVLQRSYGYHLYTPEQTVARARSRIGESHYNLVTNNCEHFVIWCKTGVHESMQVNEMFRLLTNSSGYRFRRPFRW